MLMIIMLLVVNVVLYGVLIGFLIAAA
jgi:hypothetical protein